jgi:hypothetical protein
VSLLDRAQELTSQGAIAWVRAADQLLQAPSRIRATTDVLLATAQEHGGQLRDIDLERLLSPDTPRFGVFGAGLFRLGDEFVPAVFVMPELVGLSDKPAIEVFNPARDLPARSLIRHLELEIPAGGVLVGLPQPIENGISVQCDMRGTIGAAVTLADDSSGVLTAGHVGKTVGAPATVDGRPIGTVTYSNHRALHQSPEASADVAVISLSNEGRTGLSLPVFQGLGSATQLARVRALTSSGTNPNGDFVRAIQERFALDELGEWQDVALVDAAISIGGDSGAAVVNDANEVIGQIVGGHPPAYSLVQDMELLLQDANVSLR